MYWWKPVCVHECVYGGDSHSVILTAVSAQVRNHSVISQCSRTKGKVMKDCCRLNHSECEMAPSPK